MTMINILKHGNIVSSGQTEAGITHHQSRVTTQWRLCPGSGSGVTATDTALLSSAPLTCQRSNKTKEKRKQKFGSKHPLVTRDLTVKFDRHYLIITPSPLTRLRQYQSVHTTTTTARPGAGASPGEYYCFEHRHFEQKKGGKIDIFSINCFWLWLLDWHDP